MTNKQKSKKPEEKKQPKEKEAKPVSWTVIIIAAVALIVIFFAVMKATAWWNTKDDTKYNGFVFTPVEGGYWQTDLTINGRPYVVQFHRQPSDVDTIPFDNTAKTIIESRPRMTYITTDPDYPSKAVIAGVEIAKILGKAYGVYNLDVKAALTRPAFKTDNTTNTTKLTAPIITCANANQNITVIQIYIGEQTRVIQKEGCIIVEGETSDDTIRAADRFAYGLLGIIP